LLGCEGLDQTAVKRRSEVGGELLDGGMQTEEDAWQHQPGLALRRIRTVEFQRKNEGMGQERTECDRGRWWGVTKKAARQTLAF
jgi:hypothetical protein